MFNKDILLKELTFKAVRSSGAGGQHVNKVSSKVELTFNLKESLAFSEEQLLHLQNKLQNKLTKEGVLMLQCEESRSQHKNKELVIKRFLDLIASSFKVPKKRIATKIPKAIIRKRLKSKRQVADKKANRRKPDLD